MLGTLGLLGHGGHAREVADYAAPERVAFWAVSDPAGFVDERVIALDTTDPEALATPVVAAVGAPGLRRLLVEGWGGTGFRTIVAEGTFVSPSASIGPGSMLAPGSAVTAGAELGAHVVLGLGSSVSHDSTVGDFGTLAPGARVSGGCSIGAGVFLGTGALVSHGVSIAAGTVLGAGAVVVDDITEPGVYVGAPARRVRELHEWIVTL